MESKRRYERELYCVCCQGSANIKVDSVKIE